MQTALADFIRDTPDGQEANAILRSCVHCGFCTATCPTYLLLGDEQDSPRGRIYLIKEMLEGGAVTAKTQSHLDRCLTCRSCETTCPSGVRFGRLVDIGRKVADERVRRPLVERTKRWAIREGMLARPLFGAGLAAARALPSAVARRPARSGAGAAPGGNLARSAAPAQDARARQLRAGRARAQHRRRDGARARPDRRIARPRPRGRVLRGAAVSPRCGGTRDRVGQAQHRRVVAARGSRCRGDRRHGNRLRCHGQGLWAPAAGRPRLCRESESDCRARARSRSRWSVPNGRRSRRRWRWTTGRRRSRSTRLARCSTG